MACHSKPSASVTAQSSGWVAPAVGRHSPVMSGKTRPVSSGYIWRPNAVHFLGRALPVTTVMQSGPLCYNSRIGCAGVHGTWQ